MKNIKKGKKRTIALYVVLRFLVVAVMVFSLFKQDYNSVFVCALTLVMFTIPVIIDHRFNIKLPSVLEGIILLFIFAAQILGEIQGFYLQFEYWDTMLHTLNGFIMAAIGFAMIDILNQSPKLHFNMSPIFVAFVSFCFSMTIGVLWEFFEYFMDTYAIYDMQKDAIVSMISSVDLNPDKINTPIVIKDITSTVIEGSINGVRTSTIIKGGYLDIGLVDTMHDLVVNCIGALAFSVIGVLYIKGRGHFAKNFIPVMKTEEEIELTRQLENEIKEKYINKRKRKKDNEHQD